MEKQKPVDEESALRLLKEKGYSVGRPFKFKKHTFEIEAELYKEFSKIQVALRLKVKEAFNIAVADWVIKNKPKLDSKK